MIVVIADDFTGAAEIGGVALRCGLTAEVQSEFDVHANVDLIAVDTDTRSGTADEAARRVASVARRCRQGAVERVFKKVDSVLRGHVIVELTGLLRAYGRCRALLVPANPTLGRVITGGQYFVGGQPLQETGFAGDPEYPARTSDVLAILGPGGSWPVHVLQPGRAMQDEGILVGEATSEADLATWARELDDKTLPAGAAEFFAAFMTAMGYQAVRSKSAGVESAAHPTVLFVCGSISSYSRSFSRRCEVEGIPVLRMPRGLVGIKHQSPKLMREWADTTVRALDTHRRVVLTIDQPLGRDASSLPKTLSSHLAELVDHAIRSQRVDHLLVEGGATAAALVRQLGWRRLRVRRELAPGVVCMQAGDTSDPLLTTKPGSYSWPDEVLSWSGLPPTGRGQVAITPSGQFREP